MVELWELIQWLLANTDKLTLPTVLLLLVFAGVVVWFHTKGAQSKAVLRLIVNVIEQFLDADTAKQVKQAVAKESKIALSVREVELLDKVVDEAEAVAGK